MLYRPFLLGARKTRKAHWRDIAILTEILALFEMSGPSNDEHVMFARLRKSMPNCRNCPPTASRQHFSSEQLRFGSIPARDKNAQGNIARLLSEVGPCRRWPQKQTFR